MAHHPVRDNRCSGDNDQLLEFYNKNSLPSLETASDHEPLSDSKNSNIKHLFFLFLFEITLPCRKTSVSSELLTLHVLSNIKIKALCEYFCFKVRRLLLYLTIRPSL